MTSDLSMMAINNIITRIELAREDQDTLDLIYEDLCDTIKTEMASRIPMFGSSKRTSKRWKHKKPYWNNELQDTWNTMRLNENAFLKCHESRHVKTRLRMDYISARNAFNKLLHQNERAYRNAQALDIEEMSTSNPNDFWRKIQKLGPRKDRLIPTEIVNSTGESIHSEQQVFEKWRLDFFNLYNCEDTDGFDEFYYDRYTNPTQK